PDRCLVPRQSDRLHSRALRAVPPPHWPPSPLRKTRPSSLIAEPEQTSFPLPYPVRHGRQPAFSIQLPVSGIQNPASGIEFSSFNPRLQHSVPSPATHPASRNEYLIRAFLSLFR